MIQQLVAHRGYAARYPENTLIAMQAAVDAGARFLECDIQLTRDGVPVLLHDENFMRTAGDAAIIHQLDFAALDRFDVGERARFGERFAGTRVSSVAEIVNWLRDCPDVTLFVEVKEQSLDRVGVDALLDALLPVLEPVARQCVIISFASVVPEECRRRCRMRTGWVLRHWDDESHARAQEMQPDFIYCNVDKLPPEPEPLWQGSWDWAIYEITDPVVAAALGLRGVAYIESMAVEDMLAGMRGSDGR